MNLYLKHILIYAIVLAGGMLVDLLGFHQRILIDDKSIKRDTFIWGLRMSTEVLHNTDKAYELASEMTHSEESTNETHVLKTALVRLPYGLDWCLDSDEELNTRVQTISDYVKKRYEEDDQ